MFLKHLFLILHNVLFMKDYWRSFFLDCTNCVCPFWHWPPKSLGQISGPLLAKYRDIFAHILCSHFSSVSIFSSLFWFSLVPFHSCSYLIFFNLALTIKLSHLYYLLIAYVANHPRTQQLRKTNTYFFTVSMGPEPGTSRWFWLRMVFQETTLQVSTEATIIWGSTGAGNSTSKFMHTLLTRDLRPFTGCLHGSWISPKEEGEGEDEAKSKAPVFYTTVLERMCQSSTYVAPDQPGRRERSAQGYDYQEVGSLGAVLEAGSCILQIFPETM